MVLYLFWFRNRFVVVKWLCFTTARALIIACCLLQWRGWPVGQHRLEGATGSHLLSSAHNTRELHSFSVQPLSLDFKDTGSIVDCCLSNNNVYCYQLLKTDVPFLFNNIKWVITEFSISEIVCDILHSTLHIKCQILRKTTVKNVLILNVKKCRVVRELLLKHNSKKTIK